MGFGRARGGGCIDPSIEEARATEKEKQIGEGDRERERERERETIRPFRHRK
mgnify:CR=1 FL=1